MSEWVKCGAGGLYGIELWLILFYFLWGIDLCIYGYEWTRCGLYRAPVACIPSKKKGLHPSITSSDMSFTTSTRVLPLLFIIALSSKSSNSTDATAHYFQVGKHTWMCTHITIEPYPYTLLIPDHHIQKYQWDTWLHVTAEIAYCILGNIILFIFGSFPSSSDLANPNAKRSYNGR